MKKITSALLILIFVFATAGCTEKETTKKEAKKVKMTIGVLPIEDTLPFFVAEEKGYFKSDDLEVELITFDSAHERDAAFQAGKIDAFLGDPIAAASFENAGKDVSIATIVLGATPEEGRFAIFAAPESNITSLEQLKGTEIAVSNNSIIEYFVDELLLSKGFDDSEIKKIEIPKIPVRLDMLLSNQAKAAALPDPLASLAELKGAKLIIDDTQGQNLTQTILAFDQKYLKEHEVSVRELLKALSKAVDDINKDPESFKDLLVEKAKLPEPIKESYKVNKFPEPQLPKQEDIDRVLEWMDSKDLLDKDITYQNLVAPSKILP